MREMLLNRIKIDENRHEQVIVLKEKNGEAMLPVVIGLPEVHAIKLKLSGIKTPRPLTHDLILDIIRSLGGTVERIVIDKLENKTFFAKVYITTAAGEEAIIDARPSDSIALALRANVPIFVEDEIIQEAGL
jgi:bifunctional DNase/RNase